MATAFTADLFAADTLPAVRPLDPQAGPGFEIGWDYAHHRLTPPPEALADGHPVHQGWRAGAATFGQRTLKPTPQVRKWLQLRLSAWRRGRAFEGTQVTPNFLGQIDVTLCPVTRVTLTHASGVTKLISTARRDHCSASRPSSVSRPEASSCLTTSNASRHDRSALAWLARVLITARLPAA
jgi:hypothetical protein